MISRVSTTISPVPALYYILRKHGRPEGSRNPRERCYHEQHRLLVHALIVTGMLSDEALQIRREQIELERRAIQLEKTKTNQPRVCRIYAGQTLRGA